MGDEVIVDGDGYDPKGEIENFAEKDNEKLKELLSLCYLSLTADVVFDEHKGWQPVGDPTEAAIAVVCKKAKLKKDKEELIYKVGTGLITSVPEVKNYLLDSSEIYHYIDRRKIENMISKETLTNSQSKFLFYFLNSSKKRLNFITEEFYTAVAVIYFSAGNHDTVLFPGIGIFFKQPRKNNQFDF